jgi:dienelactone hydrolase
MRLLLCFVAFLSFGSATLHSAPPPPAGEKLDWKEPLDERMMDGLHKFIERKLDDAAKNRERFWKRDFSSKEAYEKSVEPNRRHLRSVLGIKAERLPTRVEFVGTDEEPAVVTDKPHFRVLRARWLNSDRLLGEGLVLEPKETPTGYIVVLPDADETPEEAAGLLRRAPAPKPPVKGPIQIERFTVPARALTWANRGCYVIVPTLISRSDTYSGNPDIARTNQTHREWIWRQSYHVGLHPLGLETEAVLSLFDWLERIRRNEMKFGVVGDGEGGLIAMLSAACDLRIDGCYVSGCFAPHSLMSDRIAYEEKLRLADPKERERLARHPVEFRFAWEEPIDRHVWKLHREFGAAEVASLIAPRFFFAENSRLPNILPPTVRSGRINAAAKARLLPVSDSDAAKEFQRLNTLAPRNWEEAKFIPANQAESSPVNLREFIDLMVAKTAPNRNDDLQPIRYDPEPRQERLVRATETYVQTQVREAERKREAQSLATLPKPMTLEQWEPRAKLRRENLWENYLGKFDDPYLPLNPRVRQIYDQEKWTGYDVVLDVFPDVFAWGVLLVPKDIKEGERRPVVVCQHGRNGLPKDVIEGDVKAYHDFAAKLCDRGFIVFAPHNPYRGEDKYRYLSRKANGIGCTLFSFILAQHEQILSWLGTLPYVDDQRIAFYGLSYGGETAVRVPPILTKYCLSICSADFNMWTRKVASTEERFCFPYTIEWEMPYWDMGNHFDYAEMAYLMAPRPFMVERGHRDGVSKDEWVAYEYAKVRRFYDELGIGDRTEIEFFNGVHEINGQGTFEFLHKHLKWAKR